MRRFLKQGSAGSAAWIALLLAAGLVAGALEAQVAPGRRAMLLLLAAGLPLVAVAAWLISAKLARDAAAVQAANARPREPRSTWDGGRAALECDEEALAALVEDELDALPAWLAAAIAAHNVAVTIDEEPPGEPHTLGLFRRGGGTSEITIYRAPIVRLARDEKHLRRIVHDTVLHELGHLFGMTEGDLDRFTIGNNPLPGAQPVHPPRRPGGTGIWRTGTDPEPGRRPPDG
jgi:predicted Zn-dependent protease with MMP-like domain